MNIKTKLNNLPTNPGCYLFYNINKDVIYVGKAKNLKNRVKSYFNGAHSGKTQRLVNDIVDLEYVITKTEKESLLLEYNLIKKYYPKYNILLKDDKSYPYVMVSKEEFPRVSVTREAKKKKGFLYGPYTNVNAARQMVEYINKSYKTVKCKRFKKEACIYYHLNQCDAPCVRDVNVDEYNTMIDEIKGILNGNVKKLLDKLTILMHTKSNDLNFEAALEYKNMIEAINTVIEKQIISANKDLNVDVVGYCKNESNICIQVLHIRNGLVIERTGEIFEYIGSESTILQQYLLNIYYEKTVPDEIIIKNSEDFDVVANIIGAKFSSYQKGHKKNLVNMAEENAKIIIEKHNASYVNKVNRKSLIREELRQIIDKEIFRIDGFDISHYSGVYTVGAMIVALDFEFVNKLYRKFKLSVDQNNDVASMKEVVYRRYYKMLMENEKFPDLICIDGGKNQVNVVKEVLESLNLKIDVIGLVKNKYHTTESILYNDVKYTLNKSSELFKFLTSFQDEVHRFAINYHNSLRAKSVSASVLDEIDGVGTKRKMQLIKYFKSLDNIKNASVDDLSNVVPKNIAQEIYNHFNKI